MLVLESLGHSSSAFFVRGLKLEVRTDAGYHLLMARSKLGCSKRKRHVSTEAYAKALVSGTCPVEIKPKMALRVDTFHGESNPCIDAANFPGHVTF